MAGNPFFLKMGAGPLKKRAVTPFSRKKGVPTKIIIPKCTDQVFHRYRFGKNQEITNRIPTKKNKSVPNSKAHSVARLLWYYFGYYFQYQNSTKIVPETSKKNGVFGGGFWYYSWYYLWYYFFDVIMSCDQDKTGTGLRFLVDARRSCRPCRLSPLASAATIIATFSTAAFS